MISIEDVLAAKVKKLEAKIEELQATDTAQQEEAEVSACGSIGNSSSDVHHKHRDNLYLGLQLLQTLDKNSKNYAAIEAKVVGLFDKLTEV